MISIGGSIILKKKNNDSEESTVSKNCESKLRGTAYAIPEARMKKIF